MYLSGAVEKAVIRSIFSCCHLFASAVIGLFDLGRDRPCDKALTSFSGDESESGRETEREGGD